MFMMFSLFFLGRNDPELKLGGPYAPFSAAHIAVTLTAFVLVALAVRFIRRQHSRSRLALTGCVYGFLVLLNILRLVWESAAGEFDIRTSLPLELCGLQMFILPPALFSRGRFGGWMREFAFSYGTLGFVLSLIMPFTTLYDYPVWHFRTMQSVLYHSALGIICLSLPGPGYEPQVRNARKAYVVLAAAAVLSGTANILTGGNYMYTAALPLPTQIVPWPYYLPLLLGFALLAGRLPYYAFHFLKTRKTADTASDYPNECNQSQ